MNMIIDMHCHLADEKWVPRSWWEGLAKVAIPVLKKAGMGDITEEVLINQLMPAALFDPTGERQLQSMDEAGIDKVVLFASDFGEAPLPIEEVNKIFADLQRAHPTRFITFVSVDPRRKKARDIVKKALEEWGMLGVKLHPGVGFYPNGKETYALLEMVSRYEIPVMCHTGHILQPLYSKYCDPMHLDDVCTDFPNLIIIAAHMGHGYRDQLCHMGACNPNLYTDISDNQRRAAHEYRIFAEAVRSSLDNFGTERVLFGTDGPYIRQVMSDKDYVQLIKDLPKNAPPGITFTPEEIEAVLGGNAARLLKLI